MLTRRLAGAVLTSCRRQRADEPAKQECCSADKLSTLVLYLFQHLVEGVGELLDAFLLQDVGYVFVVEAGFSESHEESFGFFDALFEGRPYLGVVHDGLDGFLGHGVDGLGPYEVVDVEGVGVVGVLGRGRGPQKALAVGALLGELAPTGAAEDFFVDLVGQFGVGYGELALEVGGPELLQLRVGLGVYPGDEEARHGVYARGVSPVLDQSLEAPGVGAGHFTVTLEGEDQGDVYGLAAGDHLLYRDEPW